MASSTSLIFNGSSQFSSDFQNIISRAAAIASLPIRQLNADKTSLSEQAAALDGLGGKFQALTSAIAGIETALSGSSFEAELSDDSKISVVLGAGAMEGNYSIEVVDAGAYATSMTAANWTAGTGPVRSYRLSVGGEVYTLAPADNSAGSLAAAVNSRYGDKVHATVVNVGSSSSPDYRISLEAVRLGDLKPDILTGPAAPLAVQTQMASGSNTLAGSRTAQPWNAGPGLTLQLSLGGELFDLTPVDNSAESVAEAVNTQYGGRVTATVVNLGSEAAPDYRIALEAVNPGDLRPDLLASDGVAAPVSLQEQLAAGSNVRASSRTTNTWDAASGPVLTYQLSLGGVNYSLSPSANTADALVSEINTKYGDKVQAAVIDLGTPASHDYRISLTAVEAGDLLPGLIVSEASLQTQQTAGTEARYIVNASGREISSATRSVSIAPGVTVTLLAASGGNPVNITVARPTSALATALGAFADAYNAAVDELDRQHGPGAGALSGQSVLNQLSRELSGIGTYAPANGGISGLADLGLDLDKTGHLRFTSFALIAADLVNASAVTGFLGTPATGGFLKWASDSLKRVEDSAAGLIATARRGVDTQMAGVTNKIGEIQARVDQMTERMQTQMAAMDALIASMEQQYNYLYGMFQSMQAANRQYS